MYVSVGDLVEKIKYHQICKKNVQDWKKKIGVSFFFFWLGHLRVRTKQDGFPFLYNLLIYIYVVRDKCEIFDLCRVQWVHARHNKKKTVLW